MKNRCFFPSLNAGRLAGVAVAALLMTSCFSLGAQTGTAVPLADAATTAPQDTAMSSVDPKKTKKDDKVVVSKDTKKEIKKTKKSNPLVGQDAKLPDKQLYDKAMDLTKRGHFDVARLDLQTLLNTYPDSEYQMRAKLAIADSWYREGGTAALTQAEAEYADFRVFFPNAPEAAEAQMRIGDIYFRQMDKPDRDYSKATHAEEEYRRMLTDYPDSTLVPEAKQRLREVQEAMATRESDIGAFYATHANWAATIARYQTVVDSYPQYSHMDDVLIGLGDAYETQARYIRTLKLPEAGKVQLEKNYDGLAAAAYRRVVVEHSASPHVEDARDRLAAMNLPIPAPTPEQVASSATLENSRRQYRIQDRLGLMFLRKPDTVQAATVGDPSLADPRPTTAPEIFKQITAEFNNALNPNAPKAPVATASGTTAAGETAAVPAPAGPAVAAPLQLNEVPNSEDAPSNGAVPVGTGAPARAPAGNSMGVEIISHPASETPATTPATTPAATAPGPANNYGLVPVGPKNATPLPPVEKAADAPTTVNEVPTGAAPVAGTSNANGKNPKPELDKSDESSSKHKPKKGLGKLNPF